MPLPGYGKLYKLLTGKKPRLKKLFLLKALPKRSVGAEIGVHEGDLSARILEIVEPVKLHLIDPWKYHEEPVYEDAVYGGKKGGDQPQMDERYKRVIERFRAHIESSRVVVHRACSHEVHTQFPPRYFDWVYIDANHRCEAVKQDLELFLPLVKQGGLITGDDYDETDTWGGVKQAVDEFVASGRVTLVQVKNCQFILRNESA
jgi:hypothetical protein